MQRTGATVFIVRPLFTFLLRFALLILCFPLFFPICKFLLPFLALIESQNVRQKAAGDGLDLMLWNGGIID